LEQEDEKKLCILIRGKPIIETKMALQTRRRQEEVARRKRSRAGRSRLEVGLITNSLKMLSWIDLRRSITYGLNTKAMQRNGARKKSLTSSQMTIKPSWTSCCKRAL